MKHSETRRATNAKRAPMATAAQTLLPVALAALSACSTTPAQTPASPRLDLPAGTSQGPVVNVYSNGDMEVVLANGCGVRFDPDSKPIAVASACSPEDEKLAAQALALYRRWH